METSYATFYLDGQLMGIPVGRVDEVLGSARLTRVPLALPSVAGLLNLRGEIVVAQDMRVTLQRPPREAEEGAVHVVIRVGGEPMSLLFDRAGDVVQVDDRDVEAPPPTLPASVKQMTLGVVQRKGHLLLLLDLDRASQLD